MKAAELRIGNWVKHFQETRQLIAIDNMYLAFLHDGIENIWKDIEDCHPIPLTPEILEKAGFKKTDYNVGGGEIGIFSTYTEPPFTYNTNHGWWFNKRNIEHTPARPAYLHQLQNLFFALTGTELNIEL